MFSLLLYIMSLALALLWMLDALFTVQVLRKKGAKKEANGLMRDLYRKSVFFFILIKIAIMLFVLFAILMLSKDYLVTAESVLLIFIYVYAKVDWHNYKIWKNRNGTAKDKKIIKASPETPSPKNAAFPEQSGRKACRFSFS